jgi:hypothetical protein
LRIFGQSQLWKAEKGKWIVPRQWELRLPRIALLLYLGCGGVEEVYMEVM